MDRLPEFVGNHPLLSLAFVGLLLALIFTEIGRRFRGFREVSPAELTALINRSDAALIDVSSQADFQKGHIGSAKHVPLSQVDPNAKVLAKLKEKPVAVYCKTGQQSGQAASKLAKAGFSQVYLLRGGLAAWHAENFPVKRGK